MPELTVRIDHVLSFPDPRESEHPHRLLIRFLERLDTSTTHVNPAFSRAQQMGRRVDPSSERIKLLASSEGRCELPRGCLQEVREAAKATGILITWDPQIRTNGTKPIPLPSLEKMVSQKIGKPWGLRPEYQPDIVRLALERRQGMIVLPCGGGKTIAGASAAISSGEATLVLVHTEDLLEQWVGAIRFLSGFDPRVVGGGSHDPRPLSPGEIVVGMVQTISQNLETYSALLGSVGFLLVDECHRAPADLFAGVINRCQGRFRLGLSATPNRADGYGFLISALIGPTIYRLPRGAIDLIEWGYLRRPLVVPVSSGFAPSDRAKEWTISCPDCEADKKREKKASQVLASTSEKDEFLAGRLFCRREGRKSVRCSYVFSGREPVNIGKLVLSQVQTEAAIDPVRVGIASSIVADGVEAGRLVLTLTNRKDGVAVLVEEQRRRGIQVRGATSETEARGAVISGFRAGRHRSLVATQLADEGLDVPMLDLLVMTSGGRHDGTAQQRVGRICRPAGKDVPLCFDLVDDYSSALSQWRERASAYVDAYGEECLPTDRPVSLGIALRIIHALEEGVSLEKIRAGLSGRR